MVKGMPEKIKESLTMSAKKKPFQVQHTVLSIKNEDLVFRNPGTGGQSDIAPESL